MYGKYHNEGSNRLKLLEVPTPYTVPQASLINTCSTWRIAQLQKKWQQFICPCTSNENFKCTRADGPSHFCPWITTLPKIEVFIVKSKHWNKNFHQKNYIIFLCEIMIFFIKCGKIYLFFNWFFKYFKILIIIIFPMFCNTLVNSSKF